MKNLLISALGGSLIAMNCTAKEPAKKNLLFIITDQQRFDALSYAGNKVVSTPNIDRLARQGAYFKNAYTPCAVSGPARSSILTGCTVENHKVLTNELAYKDPEGVMIMPTFDELLGRNGYNCEYYGKWHSEMRPTLVYKNPDQVAKNGKSVFGPGGQKFIYIDFLNEVFPKKAPAPGQFYDDFTERSYIPNLIDKHIVMSSDDTTLPKKAIQPDLHGELLLPSEYTLTAFQAKQTIDALERNKNNAFSITCAFHFPHAPMLPTKPYSGMYPAKDMTVSPSISDKMLNSPYLKANGRLDNTEYSDSEKIKYMMSDYYGLVKEIDDWVGKILDKLRELGLEENTMVIFTSDHGEMLGAHGMREKNVFYEESSHIPLVIKFAGEIKPSTVKGYVSTIDLFATILDYLKLPPCHSDGESLRGLIEGTDKDHGKYVVTEWLYHEDRSPAYMIVKDGWKMFIPYSAESKVINALYDLKKDPYEMNNLLGNNPERAKYLKKANELREDILTWLKKSKSEHFEGVKARELI